MILLLSIGVTLIFSCPAFAQDLESNQGPPTIEEQSAKVQELEETLGVSHESTLMAKQDLAFSQALAGDFVESEKLLRTVIAEYQRIAGRTDKKTLDARSLLARIVIEQGRHDEAIEDLQKILEIQAEREGDNSEDRVATHKLLASAYKRSQAHDLENNELNEVVRVLTESKGADDIETLRHRRLVGKVLMDQGQLAAARDRLKEVSADMIRVLGQNHEATMVTLKFLAFVHDKLGEVDEAIELYQTVLDSQKSTLGMLDPETLDTASMLVSTLTERGRFMDAIRVISMKLEATREKFRDDERPVADVRLELEHAFERGGYFLDAAEQQLELLKVYEKLAGKDHPKVIEHRESIVVNLLKGSDFATAEEILVGLLSHHAANANSAGIEFANQQLVTALNGQQKFDEAIQLGKDLVAKARESQPPEFESLDDAKRLLSKSLIGAERYEEAQNLLQEVLQQRVAVYGKKDERVFEVRHQLAELHGLQGDPMKSIEELEVLLEDQLAALTDESSQSNITRNSLATAYVGQSMKDKAIGQYKVLAENFEQDYGAHDRATLGAKNDLAFVLFANNQFDVAEAFYRDVLEGWYVREGGGEQFEQAFRMVASCLSSQDRHEEAEQMFRVYLENTTNSSAHTDDTKAEARALLGVCLKRQNKFEEARPLLQSAYEHFLEAYGADHFKTQSLKESLDEFDQ